MTSEDNKTFSLTLSPQMILGLILTVLPVIAGSAYAGITFFNKMQDTIEAVDSAKPYDDTELREQVQAFSIEMKSVKERQLATAEQAVRIAEKASDAIALARETSAVSRGSAAETKAVLDAQGREVNAKLSQLKNEIDSAVSNLRTEMNALKRATTNPMSK
jgi:chromosome segregation ATPase